jgi:hypothetical protein
VAANALARCHDDLCSGVALLMLGNDACLAAVLLNRDMRSLVCRKWLAAPSLGLGC